LVKTADLDLRTPEGQAALRYRLDRAIDSVCGTADPASSLDKDQRNSCRRTLAHAAHRREATVIASRTNGPLLAKR
jgi:UrcA family protein